MNLKFIKGNPDDIQGNVVVVGKFVNLEDLKKTVLSATYGTYDYNAFLAKICDQDTVLSDIEEQIPHPKKDGYTWYSFDLPSLQSELDLASVREDVIDAGIHNDFFDIRKAISSKMSKYRNATLDGLKEGTIKPLGIALDTYGDFHDEKSLKDHITTKYINPLIYAKLCGNHMKSRALNARFIRFFSEHKDLVECATEICSQIKSLSSSNPSFKSIDAIVEKLMLSTDLD